MFDTTEIAGLIGWFLGDKIAKVKFLLSVGSVLYAHTSRNCGTVTSTCKGRQTFVP